MSEGPSAGLVSSPRRFLSQRSPGKRSAPGALHTGTPRAPGAALGLTRATVLVLQM